MSSDYKMPWEEAFLDAGAAVILQNISVLTRRQARTLFERAAKAAKVAEDLELEAYTSGQRAKEDRREQRTAPPASPLIDGAPAHELLEIPASANRVEVLEAWRRLARHNHPDRPGGSEAAMSRLNRAKDAMLQRSAA